MLDPKVDLPNPTVAVFTVSLFGLACTSCKITAEVKEEESFGYPSLPLYGLIVAHSPFNALTFFFNLPRRAVDRFYYDFWWPGLSTSIYCLR